MNDIQLELNQFKQGRFFISENDETLAEMKIGISQGKLIAYHTEVSNKLQGLGIAKKLLDTMVSYARNHELKVVALCPYVNAQFRRHPELYEDIWLKDFKKAE